MGDNLKGIACRKSVCWEGSGSKAYEAFINMGMHIGIKFMPDLMLHRHPVFLEIDIQ